MSPFGGHLQTRWKEIHHPKTRRKGFNLKNLVTFWKTHPARFPDHLQTRQIEKLILQGKAPPTPVQVQEIEQLLLDSASGSTRRECPAHLPSPAGDTCLALPPGSTTRGSTWCPNRKPGCRCGNTAQGQKPPHTLYKPDLHSLLLSRFPSCG